MADYRQSCEGCSSYTGFTGHAPYCRYGGRGPYKGMTREEYIEARNNEKFTLFIKIPAVYECNRCGSLVTASGRSKHLSSHKSV